MACEFMQWRDWLQLRHSVYLLTYLLVILGTGGDKQCAGNTEESNP